MKRLFVGMPEADLLAMLVKARAAAASGATVNWSAAGVTVSKAQALTPADVILEIRYALQKLDPVTYGRDLLHTRTKAGYL